MGGIVGPIDAVVQAAECIDRGEMGHARGLTSRALGLAARFPFRRDATLWQAALDVSVTGCSEATPAERVLVA